MKVYVVCSSNCEAWEDYHWSIESVWQCRADAVRHIEEQLDMKQVSMADPSRPWTHDRWERVCTVYPTREEAESDEEWESWHDKNGELIPDYEFSTDAWIEEYDLMERLEDWRPRYHD